MKQIRTECPVFQLPVIEKESRNFQCEETSSPFNPSSTWESRCSRLRGQDQGKVQHQQSVLQQRGRKIRVKTLQLWCESVCAALTWIASFPAVCLMSFSDWQWSRRCSPQAMSTCTAHGDAQLAGGTETLDNSQIFWVDFFKSGEVEKHGSAVWGLIQDHLTLNVKPRLWKKKLDSTVRSSSCWSSHSLKTQFACCSVIWGHVWSPEFVIFPSNMPTWQCGTTTLVIPA